MQIDGRALEGAELTMHVLSKQIPDKQTREALMAICDYVSRCSPKHEDFLDSRAYNAGGPSDAPIEESEPAERGDGVLRTIL
jgi:hypothetical protein